MISVSRVPRVPHSHEAKFRHKANPAVAFPQISAVGRSVAEARYDRRQSARAGRRGSPMPRKRSTSLASARMRHRASTPCQPRSSSAATATAAANHNRGAVI